MDGVAKFWARVDVQKCTKYICHLHKVVPKVIIVGGDATGYSLIMLLFRLLVYTHCGFIVVYLHVSYDFDSVVSLSYKVKELVTRAILSQ